MSEEFQTNNTEIKDTTHSSKRLLFIFLLLGGIVLVGGGFFSIRYLVTKTKIYSDPDSQPLPSPALHFDNFEMEQFSSVEDFKTYIVESESYSSSNSTVGSAQLRGTDMMSLESDSPAPTTAGGVPTRTSETNVQVESIDEPDIVKAADGKIYVSANRYYRNVRPLPLESSMEPITPTYFPPPSKPEVVMGISILNAFPPEEMKKLGGIDNVGNLLLSEDVLVVFADTTVFGYDVSSPEDPKELWSFSYGEETTYKDARLYGTDVYLVTNTWYSRTSPCPITPIKGESVSYSISCTDVYYPIYPLYTNSTFTVFKISTKDGEVLDKVSFVGAGHDSVIYMSEDSFYITYSYAHDYVDIFMDFVKTDGSDIFSEEVLTRVKKLASYDISSDAKMMELGRIMDDYLLSLAEDDTMQVENELQDRMDTYMKNHVRDLQATGVVKFSTDNLSLVSTGNVPGHPLNQFSLDEYKENLRIATTSQGVWGFSTQGSVNDVYVLDPTLKELGSVKDLGLDERIYSTRFIGDLGYVVTFKETDPFYILDLSNPKKPKMTGELKIPGYSSYLHPLEDNLILGVGKEGSKVKLSLFDVSNGSSPLEIDKYVMDEYWSEVLNTHHAFLQDSYHKVFFLPGSKGGYVFSYEDAKLDLVKAVNVTSLKRAVYMDDYMYLVAENSVVVLDETTWERVKEFSY
jgi:inhibitor of cysteine peptidase